VTLFTLFSGCRLVGGYSYQTTKQVQEPEILSGPANYTVLRGEPLHIICKIKNIGDNLVVWKHRNTVLSVGNIKVRRDRNLDWKTDVLLIGEERIEAHSLIVHSADVEYSGNYTCQVEWKNDNNPPKQHYSVGVLVPPMIQALVPQIQKEEGESLEMSCVAQGEPAPNISWNFQGGNLPLSAVVNGTNLRLQNIKRKDAGLYYCTANNGAGEPATDSIHLQVQYAPVVSSTPEVVKREGSTTADLSCTVLAEPQAEVVWYRDNLLLTEYATTTNSTHSTIHIPQVQENDLGNYSCYAENIMGRASSIVSLSGRPGRVKILSSMAEVGVRQFNLSWTVDTFAPVTHTNIRIRKSDLYEGKWQEYDFHHPADTQFFNRYIQYSFPISNLDSDTRYEVKVKCQNEYGVSPFSDAHPFRTRNISYYSRTNTRDGLFQGSKYWFRSGCEGASTIHTTAVTILLLLMAIF